MDLRAKLTILAAAAKYDASCASGGSKRSGKQGGLGNTTGMGICQMHAFVRFRRIEGEGGERYVAYYKPHHLVVRLGAPFFAERFASLRFSILTPDESVHWDGEELAYSPGVQASEAPKGDELEELFRAYYRSTYNPARPRLRAMKAEMPVRHWSTLPETLAIRDLVREGEGRVAAMFRDQGEGGDIRNPRRRGAAREARGSGAKPRR